MDLNGVWASVNFPSFLPGFCGQRLQQTTSDTELALATVRAWNDWHIEAWAGAHPERIIPCQIPWLLDPELAAAEIRRNAERGFRAVTFTEAPHMLGLPSLHTGHWDPFMEACAETGTVINLHIGSSGTSPATAPDAPPDTVGVLFFGYAMFAAVDWLYSMYPVKYPDLRFCLSEGGIGWVAMLIDRLDNIVDRSGYAGDWPVRPADVLRRNFWFCTIDDPSTIDTRHTIGVENIMVEVDYPHGDGTWPDTQRVIGELWGHVPPDELRAMCCENAARLYRHPLPELVLPEVVLPR